MNAKKFFYDFGRAIYHIDAVYEDYAKQSGVAPTLLWILYALNDGGSHTQREICTEWELPKSTVNTITTELKKSGYVELIQIKGKRREMTVVLTESGKEYADELLKPLYTKEAQVFKQLTDKDRNIIEELEKIATLMRDDLGENL